MHCTASVGEIPEAAAPCTTGSNKKKPLLKAMAINIQLSRINFTGESSLKMSNRGLKVSRQGCILKSSTTYL
jgi:hypothetical protein